MGKLQPAVEQPVAGRFAERPEMPLQGSFRHIETQGKFARTEGRVGAMAVDHRQRPRQQRLGSARHAGRMQIGAEKAKEGLAKLRLRPFLQQHFRDDRAHGKPEGIVARDRKAAGAWRTEAMEHLVARDVQRHLVRALAAIEKGRGLDGIDEEHVAGR